MLDQAQFEAVIAVDQQRFRGDLFPDIADYDFAKLYVYSGPYGLEPFEIIERFGGQVTATAANWRKGQNEAKFSAVLCNAIHENPSLQRIDEGLKAIFERNGMLTSFDGRPISQIIKRVRANQLGDIFVRSLDNDLDDYQNGNQPDNMQEDDEDQ